VTDDTPHAINCSDLPTMNVTLEFIRDPWAMRQRADGARLEGRRIGVVPTMGALHEGHCSLIRVARERSDLVITTIFVNPMQFGAGEDFDRYPRDLGRDRMMAQGAGSDVIFAPSREAMYPEGFVTAVNVEKITDVLEGELRPGHFRGVATVVAKLFHITQPHLAVFGQKDAQQLAVIRRMVRDLNFGVEIVAAPIVREADGLAMSSRNGYLTPKERAEAPVLYRSLRSAENLIRGGERDAEAIRRSVTRMISDNSSGAVQYVSLADEENLKECKTLAPGDRILVLLAVRFGGTRLIDNCVVTVPA
jgi:pantoate--beta-alanine ligase